MSDLDDRFRGLDRLDAPDLWSDATRRRPGTRPPAKRPRLVPGIVAVVVALLGVGLAIRAFGHGPVAVPATQTASASPTAARCVQAKTEGDFDGDGLSDSAELVAIVPLDVSCNKSGEVYQNLTSQDVRIAFGSGATLEQPIHECGPCLTGGDVFTATDLDGDGRDELAIDVGPGAATDFVGFYRIGVDPIHPLEVAQPADPPYVKPGPAVLGGGFDSGQLSPMACRVNPDGTRELASVHAEIGSDGISGPWHIHTTTMKLEGDQLVVTSMKDETSTISLTPGVFQNGCV